MATNPETIDKKLSYSSVRGKDKLLTPKGAELELGIPRVKVYNWIKNKRFKFFKPKKEILFWRSDLLNWLEKSAIVDDEIDL